MLRIYRDYAHDADISYGEYGGANHLDIWRRPDLDRNAKAPVLFQIPGGAWTTGNKRGQAHPLMSHLAELGWICVAINYRHSPRNTWPDHIVDVKRALAWLKAHIAEYGGDPDFVAITGGSAGGHLSSLAALTPNDPRFQPGFEDADTRVQAAVPFYGVYDFTRLEDAMHPSMPELLERMVIKQPHSANPSRMSTRRRSATCLRTLRRSSSCMAATTRLFPSSRHGASSRACEKSAHSRSCTPNCLSPSTLSTCLARPAPRTRQSLSSNSSPRSTRTETCGSALKRKILHGTLIRHHCCHAADRAPSTLPRGYDPDCGTMQMTNLMRHPYRVPRVEKPRAEGRFYLPTGRRLGFAEFGDPSGDPVLWFHGTPGGRRQFPLLGRRAAEKMGLRVVAVGRPGTGLSDPHPYESVADWASDVAHIADALGAERLGVAGLSGGGPYALACAAVPPLASRVAAVAVLGGIVRRSARMLSRPVPSSWPAGLRRCCRDCADPWPRRSTDCCCRSSRCALCLPGLCQRHPRR